ncbi:GPI-anchored wall transfer protein 1 [Pseudozyma hubeiensis SY62]|uniref:GPI-anchored wall transfer protein 1 n=1 Tax=Pseudozyma hubeiensis (strain SY62) TaxID=1305764 RepID=R9P1U5_PSEHS|nr:GPI-anchored wall transfer protein 1 [Pseudozyma hubeiensis SY62]GAC95283.1 GPI-anchored wall transfer protein 1 [Pseudozyma hubeiensis SY62]
MDRPLGPPGTNEPLAVIDAVHRHHNLPHHSDHRSSDDPPLLTHSASASLPALHRDASSYKQLKEAWIADQTGSSIHVVNTLGLVMLLTYAIWAVLSAKRIRFVRKDRRWRPNDSSPWSHVTAIMDKFSDWQLEFLVLIVPAVASHTVFATHLLATNGVLIAILVCLLRSGASLPSKTKGKNDSKDKRHWSKKFSDDEDQDDLVVDTGIHATTSSLAPSATAEPEPPFRVSIDSAADAAHASAAPPNFYSGPGSSSYHSDLDLSIDTSVSTAPQSPILGSATSSSAASRGDLAFLSPDVATTSAFPSPTRRPAELTALKTSPLQLLHSRDASDAQSVVSASSAMSPLARSVVDPWGKGKHPSPSIDHSTSPATDESTLHDPPSTSSTKSHPHFERNLFVRPRPFLTVYRAHMMLVTIISILAVDFPVFPRFLSKCESWGTSWMDMGVGSFVFSLGIISALPFLKSPENRFRGVRRQLWSDFRKCLPLLALGVVRVVSVKGVEYVEHVGEYGVHWNFFFTLSVLPLASSVGRMMARAGGLRFSVVGIAISLLHQILLKTTAWEQWALSDTLHRDTLWSANKEGLTSIVGYLAIFYIGLDLGHYVLPLDPYFAYRKIRRRRAKPRTDKLAMVLASLAILEWSGFGLASVVGWRTSRRLANLPYVLWVVAFNTSFLLGYVVVYGLVLQPVEEQEGREDSMTPRILEDLNRHSLTVFLAANVLTGLVNLTIETMYTRDAVAVGLLLVYVGVCCGLARWLSARGYRLKL